MFLWKHFKVFVERKQISKFSKKKEMDQKFLHDLNGTKTAMFGFQMHPLLV